MVFPSALILRVKGYTKVLFHQPASMWRHSVVSRTLSPSLPYPVPSYWWYDSQGCWKNVKDTLKTKKGSRFFEPSSLSSFRKFPNSAFLHRRNSLLSRPVEPGETNAEKPCEKQNSQREHRVPLSSYPAINHFCGAIFSTAIKCDEGRDTHSHPVLPLGYRYNSQQKTPAFQTSLTKDTVVLYHFSSSPEHSPHPIYL